MKNIKETIIGVFAVIGFVVIASGFTTNNEAQQPTYGTPESHVWEMQGEGNGRTLVINKVTGEVKAYVFKVGSSQTVGVKAYTPKEVLYGDKG
tara:strand:+ start:117 stop:395 length:279 start_codon:yes stop_codon:yes gene_type:complete